MEPVYWLILFIVMLGIEILTLGLTTIWFAGGAAVAFFAALLGANLVVQVVLFMTMSLVLLIFTRPWAAKYFNRRTVKTNVESLEGCQAVVEEDINNLEARGTVQLNGMTWSARTNCDGGQLPAGTLVRVLRIDGVKLIVEACDPDESVQLKEEV